MSARSWRGKAHQCDHRPPFLPRSPALVASGIHENKIKAAAKHVFAMQKVVCSGNGGSGGKTKSISSRSADTAQRQVERKYLKEKREKYKIDFIQNEQ